MGYKYREVLCPFCKKPYMTRVYDEYDIQINENGKTLNGWNDICPKCNQELFVIENIYEGKDPNSYSEEVVDSVFVLR